MAWYRQGTVSVDNASTDVTGSLTGWTSQAKAGDRITFDGGGKWYEIAAVNSNTSITLATAFAEATITGGDYAIDRSGPKWSLTAELAEAVAELLAKFPALTGGGDALKLMRANAAGTALELALGTPLLALSNLADVADAAAVRANILGAPIAALAERNILINSSHLISQEHGDNAGTIPGYYASDQWFFAASGMGVSAQRVIDGPPGFLYSQKITITTAQASLGADDFLSIQQPIETSRISHLALGTGSARPSVLVGFFKSSVPGTYGLHRRSWTGSTVNRTWLGSITIASANVWEFHAVAIPPDTSGTWGSSLNGRAASIGVGLAAGANRAAALGFHAGDRFGVLGQTNLAATLGATFQYTGLMCFPGVDAPTAETAWAMRGRYDDDLRACQRYIWGYAAGSAAEYIMSGRIISGTASRFYREASPPMRISPVLGMVSSVGHFEVSSTANFAVSGLTLGLSSPTAQVFEAVIAGATAGPAILRTDGSSGGSARLVLNARL